MSTLPARTTPAFVAGLLTASLLAGCAGPSADVCRLADWRMVGYEDGLNGRPADRIGTHRVGCAKHQVVPDLAAYTEGRERGLREYCQPKSGFRVGLDGRYYANVCSGPTEAAFVDAYRSGRQIHDARSELRQTLSRLHGAKSGLVQTDVAVQAVTAELVQPKMPTDRRVFLAQELVRLAGERVELEANIERLGVRSRQLAVNVRQLEERSPYPL
jgi:hypothetical protein